MTCQHLDSLVFLLNAVSNILTGDSKKGKGRGKTQAWHGVLRKKMPALLIRLPAEMGPDEKLLLPKYRPFKTKGDVTAKYDHDMVTMGHVLLFYWIMDTCGLGPEMADEVWEKALK